MKTTPLTLLLALLALLLLPTAALAQSAEDFTDLGNNLYGEGKYREAVSA